jgi:hypothetical protein
LFERVFHRAGPGQAGGLPDHEDWSCQLVKERLNDSLAKHGVRTEVVTDLLSKQSRSHLLAKDFVSSQLDADRLDFVARDRIATGVRYGAFDLEWILHVIRVGQWRLPGSETHEYRLCFLQQKAAPAVTEFLLARAHLYRQVYIHKTPRGYEAMLRALLRRAQELAQTEPDSLGSATPAALLKVLRGELPTADEYLSLDDFRLWSTIGDWIGDARDATVRDLSERLVSRGRPFQPIELTRNSDPRAIELLFELRHEGSPLRFRCDRDDFSDVAYADPFGHSADEDEERDYRSILLMEDETTGSVRRAVTDEWIRNMAEFRVEARRLYYDDQDSAMIDRLRNTGLSE